MDITPTVLDILDVAPTTDIDGRSLLPESVPAHSPPAEPQPAAVR
ncbi:hypothetical protein [Nocardia asiatica]